MVLVLALAGDLCCAYNRQVPQSRPVPELGHVLPLKPPGPEGLNENALGHVLRGTYFLHLGKPDAAIPHLRLALSHDPGSAFVHERLATAFLARGEREKAVAAVDLALTAKPTDPRLNALAARFALRDKQPEKALTHFARAGRSTELPAPAAADWIEALLWLGRVQEASAKAAELKARHGHDPDALVLLGLRFEEQAELAMALEHYRRARAALPAHRQAALAETRVLDLMGQPDEAAEALLKLLAYYPDDLHLLAYITRLEQQAGLEHAQVYRQEALRLCEEDPDRLTQVAISDLLAGKRALGVALLEHVVVHNPHHLASRLTLAKHRLLQGDPRGCQELLGTTNADLPVLERAALLEQQAECLAATGELPAALDTLLRTVPSASSAGGVLTQATTLLAYYGEAASAVEVLGRFIERLGPRVSHPERLLAEARLADFFGAGQEALAKVSFLVSASPGQAGLRLRQADLETRYGNPEKAVAQLEALVAEDPDDFVRLNALGFTLADLNTRLEEASVWIRRAYWKSGGESFVADSLAWLLFRQGQPGRALPLLKRATWAAPSDPEILLHLGDVHWALGQTNKARAAYERALASHPPMRLRQRLLERLSRQAS